MTQGAAQARPRRQALWGPTRRCRGGYTSRAKHTRVAPAQDRGQASSGAVRPSPCCTRSRSGSALGLFLAGVAGPVACIWGHDGERECTYTASVAQPLLLASKIRLQGSNHDCQSSIEDTGMCVRQGHGEPGLCEMSVLKNKESKVRPA